MVELNVSQAFELFQTKGKQVQRKDVAMIVRSQGLCASDAQINSALSSAGVGETASLSQVQQVVSSLGHTKNDDIEATVRTALKLFDSTGGDVAAVSELSHVLHHSGSKMSKEDIDEIFRQADVDAFGQVDIDEFSRLILHLLGHEFQADA